MGVTTKAGGLLNCPVPNTHQRLRQAHILWHQVADSYQDVDLFLTNVNSLIQELRNLTFILQSEKSNFPEFDQWYGPWQERLKNSPEARWLKETRNLIVKQGGIAAASHFLVKFMTYQQIEVAALLTETEADLDLPAVLEREDFNAILLRLRGLMVGQGDAVIALERCWSTPELMGADLLSVLGSQYGFLAKMILDAHVHLGCLDCIAPPSQSSGEQEFPNERDRSSILPCMMRAQAARTDYFTLLSMEKITRGASLRATNVSRSDVELRYNIKVHERMPHLDALDPLKVYEQMVWSSKRMLRKDGSLARIMMLRDAKGEWSSHTILARNRLEKYLLMHFVAQAVREEGCDAVVEVGETWITNGHMTIAQLDSIESLPNRKTLANEAIFVRLATRAGLQRNSITIFNRGRLGGIRFCDTQEENEESIQYLNPVYQVWQEQNAYSLSPESKSQVWHPESADVCLCGSSRRYGVCCYPVLKNSDGLIKDTDALLSEGKTDLAGQHARAAVTRYVCWVRQHTALALNAKHRQEESPLIAVDCFALENLLAKLERWGTVVGEVDAVLRAYSRAEQTVAVPKIARRMVALAAQWLIENERLEEGLLELGRLGTPSEMNDTRALVLSVEFGDHKAAQRLKLLEAAVKVALDEEERQIVLIRLAAECKERGLKRQALDALDQIMKDPRSRPIHRSALGLRWELADTKENFDALVSFIKEEQSDDQIVSAAVYLVAAGKPSAALDVLGRLLDSGNAVVELLASECLIANGDCEAALGRFSGIIVDKSSPVNVQLSHAQVQATLALYCGQKSMRASALKALLELEGVDRSASTRALISSLEALGQKAATG